MSGEQTEEAKAGVPGGASVTWRRRIELPRYLRKVHGRPALVGELVEVLDELGFARAQLVSGATATAELAATLAAELGVSAPLEVRDNGAAAVAELAASEEFRRADVVVAVGGGKTIDVAKSACERAGLPVVVVPTQLTGDGIASPVSVIRGERGEVESIRARLPIGVVADLDLVARSSPERMRAGVGDLVANVCAIRDWRRAADAGHDVVDDFAALLAQAAADLVYGTDVAALGRGRPDRALVERLLDGLVLSGLAMEIAGSSRPCSGSEHLVSHAIDRLRPQTAPHGEQVAFGTVLCSRLQGEDWRPVRSFLVSAGMARAAKGFELGEGEIVAAVQLAPSTRPGRYTVLDEIELGDAALRPLVAEVLAG
jgi:glycerol-1-phosphate dehydrogenase [NAD(P)+]